MAVTAAYAFTDYKAQGQTMECVIVDLAKLPSGAFTGFAVYVALSRSHGRPTIRLLRDFDENLFTQHSSEVGKTSDFQCWKRKHWKVSTLENCSISQRET